jgi:hypothetical protein
VRPLNSALPGALAELLRDAPLSPGKVSFAWRAVVGPGLERETSVRLEGSTLRQFRAWPEGEALGLARIAAAPESWPRVEIDR